MRLLNGEEGLECEVHVNGIRLEHVLEFKYLGCVLDVSVIDAAECSRKVAGGGRVAGAIRSLVNAMDLELGYARVLYYNIAFTFSHVLQFYNVMEGEEM